MVEIWKDIKGYEGLYQISSLGRVKSLNYRRSGKEGFLSVYTMNTGYLATHLCRDNKEKVVLIHRLIAEHFIPNPENKPEIDHVNTNRLDNRVWVNEDGSIDYDKSNLRWVTSKENSNNPNTLNNHWSKQGFASPLKGKTGFISPLKGKTGKNHYLSKKVLQMDKHGNIIKLWDALMDVHRELGFDCGKLSDCCLGKRKTHKGFRWVYLDNYLADWWDMEMEKEVA